MRHFASRKTNKLFFAFKSIENKFISLDLFIIYKINVMTFDNNHIIDIVFKFIKK